MRRPSPPLSTVIGGLGKPIAIARYRGRRGHPVLFARELFVELAAPPKTRAPGPWWRRTRLARRLRRRRRPRGADRPRYTRGPGTGRPRPGLQAGVALDEGGFGRKSGIFWCNHGPEPSYFLSGMRGILAFKRFARSVSEPSDQDLVAGALNGESAAFAELATRHRPRVERICQRFFSDPSRCVTSRRKLSFTRMAG